jgi:hypothetical protein
MMSVPSESSMHRRRAGGGPNLNYVGTPSVVRALGVGGSPVKRSVDEGILPAHKTAGGHTEVRRFVL